MPESDLFSHDKEICMNIGDGRQRYEGAVVPPIYGNTLFTYDTFDKLSEAVMDEQSHFVYTRGTNPTVSIVEKKLAELERGEKCKCFGSGMAAISAALLNSLKQGDHILCVSHIYFSTLDLVKYLQKFGIEHTVVYATSPEEIERAIRKNTKVIYMENPTDMMYRLIDLKAVAELAKNRGIRTIIDNTWATPLFQKPLTLGIDMVIHSASKYLGGHSDLLGGAIIADQGIIDAIFKEEYLMGGAVLSPYEASLLLRGLRTLPLRMKVHQKNGIKIAEFLESHPAVKTVHYPGIPSHPDYQLGKRQLSGYSGLMGFDLKEEHYDAVKEVIDATAIFQIGVSWGSFESLILSPNYGTNANQLMKEHRSPGFIRLAVGLEDADLLISDLKQALDRLL
ncbi:PLP-dependent aspartate aminotransferase family protein [Bacillus sp. V59.32b]|uniref:trans-sulfuration enzyme family protein n=1 Tax=Bacillus sp. V59.32b TaxID=1758642 RepID=UPI000E3CD4A8|nr:aminotransferase class I/II-fold pyridoxal phosphate-dependent enzyme [Bacillus sp. V59.32b]RFU68214.1 aminotransferase class I/II-fold pyridoxal phosphate-dependent enzyme [Bacillus sp. V59.32b]